MKHEHLTPSTKADAIRLMTVASDPAHPEWMTAVHGICDIEKSLPREARQKLYEFLSEHDAGKEGEQ